MLDPEWLDDADPDVVRRLFAAGPDGVWVFDDSGRTTYANAMMAEILGRDLEELHGLPVHEVFDEQGRTDFAGHFARMIATGAGGVNVESHFVRPDGSSVWGLVSFSPMIGPDGRRQGWLHRVTPYTERKQLVEALTEREAQLATAQRVAHLGSWEWDVPNDVVRWSDEMCRIFGVTQAEQIDYLTYLERIHVDDRDHAMEAIDAGLQGAEFAFDHRIVRPDGEIRWIRGRGIPDLDPTGAVVRLHGTAQDTTALHLADEAAEAASRRLLLLQQMASAANRATTLREAVLITGQGVGENTTWAGVAGFLYDGAGGVEEVDLRNGADLPTADPDLADRARAAAEIVVDRPATLAEGFSLVAMPVLVGGRVAAVVELLADEVPPDENSYRMMEQIATQLGLVGGREQTAIELAVARDDAMEASRLKSEFLATMSHEIRTPMNGVIGLTELLLRTSLDDHQRRLAENLQGAGLTLLGIINDILDLSKIESGKLELEVADFEVRSVFDQVASVLGRPAHEKGLELVVACHPDVPTLLRGDQVRFGQVVTNLASNAVKFTDAGEVVIEARVERQTPRDAVLRVDVRDTGVGIAADQRERLFEAFTQADPSTTRRHGGTGLGLAISRQLVEALGGELWVTSEPGRGSTFSFTARLGLVPGSSRPTDVPAPMHGRRILVVDDNDTNRLILEEQLAAWRLEPVAVASATEALATLREATRSGHPFEVVLLDLVMPEVDGLELARRIGADRAVGPTTMVLLSSDHSVTRQQAADAGIHTSLSKPVRHAELQATLAAVLGVQETAVAADPPVDAADLRIRVLVVEDNPVNQLVATGMLESLGVSVDLASDGLEAVDRLAGDHGYDLVLMDCRMPNLDGFDATRRIRSAEATGRRVPIIAMTASALEGERERCIEAGMDDYLTKPVDAGELEHAIRTWAPEGLPVEPRTVTAPVPAPVLPPPDSEPPSGVLDRERVLLLEDLVKDGVSFFQRTAASFLNRVGGQMTAIRDAVDADNANALLTSAHQLKGSALNLGLPRVAAAAQRLESLGIAGTTEGTTPLLAVLAVEVDHAVAALEQATAERA
ncbi:response regulator [Nocardioides mangrovi]|uniref:histidine kinase n=1 Tax=Nocardioides mangrovi TaxID=2874580 RepID=A0ABS7UBW7_9ACTN|nr:PAS domain-containing hybrid sensor histidine kinase/response regulator [Nocardioides mangrovi]MBZ5738367.1 response regulator [Nocardioides mangrovi]